MKLPMSCECRVVINSNDAMFDGIERCDLCKAAPFLLAALMKILDDEVCVCENPSFCEIEEARSIIGLIESQVR